MKDIVWHDHKLNNSLILKNNPVCLWFSGLSGSGKSTICSELYKRLIDKKIISYILDGDNIRHGLNSDLGFSAEDRKENIRRIGEVSKLFVDAGFIVMTAFISPFREDRDKARDIIGNKFIEIYVKCSVEECIKRDTKGLYKKAIAGEIKNFTGISQDYEEPLNPELVLNTETESLKECVEKVIDYLVERGILDEN